MENTYKSDLIGSYVLIYSSLLPKDNTLFRIIAIEINQCKQMRVKVVPILNSNQLDYMWISFNLVKVIGNPNSKPIIKALYG